ncbi:MAG TPA: Gfo/Idh/MocA family oxidoreductase, partial [Candidatus Hydrogenedentes bacterium]|nr:Gfo/Idh/MocA family oxidoreductase [Candidatus Hydrogenedentota bacterium]
MVEATHTGAMAWEANMEHITTSRRRFLATAAAAGVFTIVPRHVLGGTGETPPSAKMNIAGIGVGGMGAHNLQQCAAENIVALCDVDRSYAAKTFAQYPNAKVYADYRRMFDEQKDIEGVVIATPDHTHAVIAMAAMRRGLHVYCQKPLTHDVYESRTLAHAARETGVTTQMGIQGHSGEGLRLICEWISDGAIGAVQSVDAWCSLSYYPPGHAGWSSKWSDRPTDTPAVPEGLDWDLWLGPAPYRPYHPAYHPAVWRCWWDFGCGMMGDRGVHTLDCVYTALQLGPPETIEASVMGGNAETHPLAAIVTFRFPARDALAPRVVTWYEGLEPPRPIDMEEGRQLPAEGGVLFRGEKGTIVCGVYGDSPRLVPESAMQAYEQPEKTLPRVVGTHEEDWIRACKEKRPAGACFDYAGPLTELALLGNVARRFPGHVLRWDAPNLCVTNLPEANEWVKRPYRDGWS